MILVRYFSLLAISVGIVFVSCRQQTNESSTKVAVEAVIPVEVTHIQTTSLSTFTELSATSAYLQKSDVKANINGYVQTSHAIIGKQVHAHEVIFSLITKEARTIGDAVNELDPTLRFSGVSNIRADQSGFITLVNHQKGDYVQDGEALAVISIQNSFVFLLDLPYGLRSILNNNPIVELMLPDGEKLLGSLGAALPTVDSVAQTLRLVVNVKPLHPIPGGLIAKARIATLAKTDASVLPRSAVLTNESEDEFWVMKLVNDSTAVKVRVLKGIEDGQSIEILDPVFHPEDRIIKAGNYGIADTAKVNIIP